MENQDIIKEYTNGEITVVWESALCIHSGNCLGVLPSVFNRRERPWIKMENASTAEIIAAVEVCPTGAISIKKC